MTPAAPAVSDRPQTVAVTGSGFQEGLKLIVTDPGGAIRTLAGQDIQSRRESSFQATVTFPAAGTYSFVVINPDGAKSNLVSVQARSGGVKPSIEQIVPDETMKSTQEQAITITGSYFAQGATVSVTDPAGAVATFRTLEKNDGADDCPADGARSDRHLFGRRREPGRRGVERRAPQSQLTADGEVARALGTSRH